METRESIINLLKSQSGVLGMIDKERLYRKNALTAAKDLRYGKDIIEQIMTAKDSDEISKIMSAARRRRK